MIIENEDGAYEGDCFDGELNGFGTLYDNNKNLIYNGGFENNMFEGVGILMNKLYEEENYEDDQTKDKFILNLDAWIKYEGTFIKNQKEGVGYLTLKNGDIFLGEFKDNQAEGLGIYYKSNGEKVIGVWKGNTFENKLE